MADIELVIKIPKKLYEAYKGRPPMLGDAGMDMIAQAIANGTPLNVIFARGKNSIETIESIPYLMHKEMGVPISDCKKAYNIAIDYLRSQGKVKG